MITAFLLSMTIAVYMQATSPTNSIVPFYEADSTEESVSAGDQKLGPVNLCDADGIKCEIGDAYQDSETGRIYVLVRGSGNTKYYTQKSNRSYWTYMIRYNNNWLYFSF